MSLRCRLFTLGLIGTFATAALGHPPDSDGNHNGPRHPSVDPASMRKWTNLKTGEVVRGTFLAARRVDGKVTVSIERENADVIAFALSELVESDFAEAQRRIDMVTAINDWRIAVAIDGEQKPPEGEDGGSGTRGQKPPQAAPFDLFAPFVKTRWDARWLFVESDGLPHVPGVKDASIYSHPMMVGIRAWQQQVPLPQPYTGDNAWRFPLKPEMADKPVSAKEQLFRGAIAIAANGVPIFNPIKNDGRTDTFLAGELDEFGGHCGRADDYHYHIAPLALQKVVGKQSPVAYALDGFPIYGLFDPAARKGEGKSCPLGGTAKLDDLNGHFAPTPSAQTGTEGLYHYHASKTYPYLNGGMRGKVTVKDDQIDPQPRANPVRQWLQPLRGARITGFKTIAEKSWSLEYTLAGRKHLVNYRIEDGGKYVFDFVDPKGTKRSETYTSRPQRDRPPPGDDRDGRRRGRGRDRDGRRGDRPPPRQAENEDPAPEVAVSSFKLSSPAVGEDGKLPAEFTCDGSGISPPLAWAKPPAGTKSFAVTMHHIPGPPRPGDRPGEDKHVYLVVYNIPANTLALAKGQTKIGLRGVNTVNRRAEYAPPCSKGPGPKKYTLTVYSLSSEPTLSPYKDGDASGVTMDGLLAAIKEKTLATASLDVTYERRRGQ